MNPLRLGGVAEAFADANFRRYSIGSIASWLSFFVQAVAVAWVTWTLTHSTRWLAIVAVLDAAPMSLLAPLGGVVADRYDRFQVLMIAYAVATAHAAALTALAFFGQLNVEWLAALALLHGVAHAFSVPAAFGLLPRYVTPQRLPSAIAVAAAYTQLGLFVGPALGGWVLLHYGATVAFASNVVGYGVFFICAASLRTPSSYRRPAPSAKPFAHDLMAGLRAIRDHAGLRHLLTLAFFGDALGAAVRQMLPAVADWRLHAGVEAFSTLLACAGVGATLSALWLAQGGRDRLRVGLVLAAFLGHDVATAALLAAPTLVLAAAAMVARGFCAEIGRTGIVGILQTSVPDNLRGRIMSAQFFVQQGASAAGVAVLGASAQTLGLAAPILVGCALALAAWFAALRQRGRIEAAFAAPDG
jgi:predicted MFS family arabinose efflux permease